MILKPKGACLIGLERFGKNFQAAMISDGL